MSQEAPSWTADLFTAVTWGSGCLGSVSKLFSEQFEVSFCPGFGWDRVNSLPSSWYSAVFWI